MTSGAYLYRAFGMIIRSDFPIAELDTAPDGQPDLVIRRGRIDRPLPELPQLRATDFAENCQYLGFATIGNYLIEGFHTITFDPAPDFDERLIGFSLLGPVMAVLLQLRGAFTLHASAVAVGDRAVIFMGDKTAGKSTTAGVMAAAGHPLLTDDVLAIADAESGPNVLPAYPMIKLTDQAIATFGHQQFALIPTEVDGFDKRRARLIAPIAVKPVRPFAAFVLQRGSAPAIEMLSTVERFQSLMRFSYAARFGDSLLKGAAATKHMQQCAALATNMLVARLIVPDTLATLTELPDYLSKTLDSLDGGQMPS